MTDSANATRNLADHLSEPDPNNPTANGAFSVDAPLTVHETTDYQARNGASRGLTIRCPDCRNPFEIVADADLTNVSCESCGSEFNLAGDSTDAANSTSIAKIAHFELIERLGMGGFGTVWKARDSQLERIVAVKIPRKGMLDAADLEGFLHEARVAAQLSHPNIVRVFEIGRDGDNAYIVSELIQGKSLSAFIQERKLTPQETAILCEKICRALQHAHETGVVHRDLKPGNILMDEQGEPHVTDFGLAKREAGDVTMTMDGRVLGTPAYMSPEQALGAISTTDRRSDVYSTGVMLFQLLTNELPFRGNVRTLIHQAINDEPPAPRTLNATIPADLETICLKCLEKEPSRRYQTAADLADEFKRFLHHEPILARPLGPAARAWRWCRRNPLAPSLAVGLAVVLAVVYAVSWLWFNAAYSRLDQELTSRALAGNLFSARIVADAAGHDLERRFEAVANAAKNKRLGEMVKQFTAEPKLQSVFATLRDPQADVEKKEQARIKLLHDSHRKKLDKWTQHQHSDPDFPVFAWFLLMSDGLQITRYPEEDGQTIGRNYAWRSYYHQGEIDKPEDWLPGPDDHLTDTKLSSAFVSQFTDQWVVVVSAPIFDGKEFVGVVGMMIELGKFAELPGNDRRRAAADANPHFAALVDSRDPHGGQILQHPLYTSLAGKRRRELLDRSQHADHLVRLGNWQVQDNYRDPFGNDVLEYDTRWLAAKIPVRVHRQDSGLHVVVQESYDEVIGTALGDLGRTVIYLSVAALALAGIVVVPLLVVMLRVIPHAKPIVSN